MHEWLRVAKKTRELIDIRKVAMARIPQVVPDGLLERVAKVEVGEEPLPPLKIIQHIGYDQVYLYFPEDKDEQEKVRNNFLVAWYARISLVPYERVIVPERETDQAIRRFQTWAAELDRAARGGAQFLDDNQLDNIQERRRAARARGERVEDDPTLDEPAQ